MENKYKFVDATAPYSTRWLIQYFSAASSPVALIMIFDSTEIQNPLIRLVWRFISLGRPILKKINPYWQSLDIERELRLKYDIHLRKMYIALQYCMANQADTTDVGIFLIELAKIYALIKGTPIVGRDNIPTTWDENEMTDTIIKSVKSLFIDQDPTYFKNLLAIAKKFKQQ